MGKEGVGRGWGGDVVQVRPSAALTQPARACAQEGPGSAERGGTVTHDSLRRCFFGDYMDEANAGEPAMRR